MSKFFAMSVCAAVLAAVGQANAADIPADTLAAMGLGDAVVVADSEAASVRGMGFVPSKYRMPRLIGLHKPTSIAAGASFANVGHEKAGAGTVNGYLAVGKYQASGENFSEAGKTTTNTRRVNLDGTVKTVTNTKSIRVFAGGYSSSMSF